jgi:hypothetical protein
MKKILIILIITLICNPHQNAFTQEADPASLLTPQENAIPPESPAEPTTPAAIAPTTDTPTTTPTPEAAPAPQTTTEQTPPAPADTSATPQPLNAARKAIDLAKTEANNINNVQKSKESAWKLGSIMFSEKDIALITAGIRSYQENVPLEILVPSLFEKSKEEVKQEEAPKPVVPQASAPNPADAANPNGSTALIPAIDTKTYYLRSIMYFSPEHWTIWLNDKKISSADTNEDPNFQFAKVSNDSIVILWQNANPDTLSAGWKNNFIDMGNGLWTSKNSNIVVDSASGSISLILKPNQSFISSQMAVIEGSPTAITTETKDDKATASTSTATAATPPVPLTPSQTAEAAKTPTGSLDNELNSPHMKQYMNQVNMLQSVLGGGKVPTTK